MRLKRIFKRDVAGELVRDGQGQLVLDHVVLQQCGPTQKFSQNILNVGMAEGWLAMSGDRIVLGTRPSVEYAITRRPGYYCCHCKRSLPTQGDAAGHVAQAHAGVESPDRQNPSGYERIHYFDCVREGERASDPQEAPTQSRGWLARLFGKG